MKRRRLRFKSFPQTDCRDCGGSGFKPATGRTANGKSMTGVVKCSCWTTIDLRKPKKAKVTYDGKALAYGE